MTAALAMETEAKKLTLTADQVKELIERFNAKRVVPSERPLIELVYADVFVAYVRQYPRRKRLVAMVLEGYRPSTAAQGLCDDSTAREWMRQFWTVAAAALPTLLKRKAQREHAPDILRSLCAFLHPKTSGGGRVSIRANMCPGCGGA